MACTEDSKSESLGMSTEAFLRNLNKKIFLKISFQIFYKK